MRRRDVLKSAPLLGLAAPALAQAQKPLRFIPQANLTVLDPIWTTAVVTYDHAYMVYDLLYGYDGAGNIKPQMAEGHTVSADQLTWTLLVVPDAMTGPMLAVSSVISYSHAASTAAMGHRSTAKPAVTMFGSALPMNTRGTTL